MKTKQQTSLEKKSRTEPKKPKVWTKNNQRSHQDSENIIP